MKLLGSRLLASMVCVNVVIGLACLGAHALAKSLYWRSPVERPENGVIQVAEGESQSGDIKMRCFEGFGATSTNFLVLAEYMTNQISFVCTNMSENASAGKNDYVLSAGPLRAELTGYADGCYRISRVEVDGDQIYPFGDDVKINRYWGNHPYKVTSTNATTKAGE